MTQIPTVKIKHNGGYAVINEQDFIEGVHELFDDAPKAKKKKKAAAKAADPEPAPEAAVEAAVESEVPGDAAGPSNDE